MGRPFTRRARLSLDIANLIKEHCWQNVSEFYKRFKIDLDMSQATFYRTLAGDYANIETVEKIERIVQLNNIGFTKTVEDKKVNEWEEKRIFVREMFRIIDLILEAPSIDHLNQLKIFTEKYRGPLES